jgi:hypothetical protein
MHRFARLVGFVSLTALLAGSAPAADLPGPGDVLAVKPRLYAKFAMRNKTIVPEEFPVPVPGSAADPTIHGATLEFFDTSLFGAGYLSFDLDASGWRGLGNPAGSRGYRYTGANDVNDPLPGGTCRPVLIHKRSIRATCRGHAITLEPPFFATAGTRLTSGSMRYCTQFGGDDVRNGQTKTVRRAAPRPGSCIERDPTPTPTPTNTGTITPPTITPTPMPTLGQGGSYCNSILGNNNSKMIDKVGAQIHRTLRVAGDCFRENGVPTTLCDVRIDGVSPSHRVPTEIDKSLVCDGDEQISESYGARAYHAAEEKFLKEEDCTLDKWEMASRWINLFMDVPYPECDVYEFAHVGAAENDPDGWSAWLCPYSWHFAYPKIVEWNDNVNNYVNPRTGTNTLAGAAFDDGPMCAWAALDGIADGTGGSYLQTGRLDKSDGVPVCEFWYTQPQMTVNCNTPSMPFSPETGDELIDRATFLSWCEATFQDVRPIRDGIQAYSGKVPDPQFSPTPTPGP